MARAGLTRALLTQKCAAEVEREQEELLKAKYGGLKPKKKLMPKVGAHRWAETVLCRPGDE